MSLTTIGMIGLLIFLIYYLFLSIKLILIGLGKIKNPNQKSEEKDKKILMRGVIGLVVSFPFFLYIVFILIQVFLV